MKKTWLTLLLFFTVATLYAQEGFLRHYSISDGLPSSETYSSFQDSKGYIWIASDMGVSRFDGYNFKVFTTADGLTDNTVFGFLEDHAGRIWFYTFSGRLSFYFNDSIYGQNLAVNEDIRNFLGSGFINNMQIDTADTVWLATGKGLIKIIPSVKNGQQVWTDIKVVTPTATYLTPTGYFTWQSLGSNSSLLIRRDNRQPDSIVVSQPTAALCQVFHLFHQSLLLIFNSTVIKIDSLGHLTTLHGPTSGIGYLQESDSVIWIGKKGGGVQLFEGRDLQKPVLTLLKSLSVTHILKDKEGGYWFPTLENGVFYMPGKQFKYYKPEEKKWDYNQCRLCTIGANKIWLLTVNGMFEPSETGELQVVPLPTITSNKIVRYLNAFTHSDGRIWISTNFGIIIVDNADLKSASLIPLFEQDKSIADSRVLFEDENHDVWSLNHSSLYKINYKTRQVVKMVAVPSRAETICQDQHGRILVGTVNGLYILDKDSFIFWGQNNPIFKNRFVDIKKAPNGMTVGATRGIGLVILAGDSIYHVSTANGLRSNMCRSVYVDNKNVIWVGTNNGLSSVTIAQHPFRVNINNFTVSDGLPSNDVENVVSVGDQVWVLTKKGIAAFNPEQALRNNYPPPVYITRLKIDNALSSVNHDSVLSYTTNFIGIDFVGLTYKNAGKQVYKYMLQGYDTAWNYTTNTFVQFTRLPSGRYRFIVKCVNNAGIESKEPAAYSFIIATPFYRTWWFAILLFVICVAAVIAIAALNVERIRRREEDKTELNRKIANLELQALRAQMNPHFIFNCLNAIQDFILKNDSLAAKHYLSSFAKLIRKTFDNSRRQNIRLTDEIDFLKLYLDLESMRFVDKFNYHITLQNGLENKHVQIPAMIIQPFIENAVRHSRIGSLPTQGELNINFSIKENKLICVIDDNGIGLNESLRLKGEHPAMREAHALDVINERIGSMNEVHNSNISYTIIDKSELNPAGTGTRVEIQIPLE